MKKAGKTLLCFAIVCVLVLCSVFAGKEEKPGKEAAAKTAAAKETDSVLEIKKGAKERSQYIIAIDAGHQQHYN